MKLVTIKKMVVTAGVIGPIGATVNDVSHLHYLLSMSVVELSLYIFIGGLFKSVPLSAKNAFVVSKLP